MAKIAGSLWVDGNNVHFVASSGVEYNLRGGYGGTSPAGAIPGSIWIDGLYLRWIGAAGHYWFSPATLQSTSSAGAGAIAGSIWIDSAGLANTTTSDQLRFIEPTNKYTYSPWYHEDVAHGDHTDDTGDTAYDDHAHIDTYHGDDTVGETYYDHNDDTPHADAHADVFEVYNQHMDQSSGDGCDPGVYTDEAHIDQAHVDHDDHSDSAHANYQDPIYVGA